MKKASLQYLESLYDTEEIKMGLYHEDGLICPEIEDNSPKSVSFGYIKGHYTFDEIMTGLYHEDGLICPEIEDYIKFRTICG